MNTRSLLLLSIGLLAGAGCGNYRDRAALSAGPWVVEEVRQDGKIKDEYFEMVFAPNGTSVNIITNIVHKGVYELHGEKDPKEIDIKPDASNLSDKPLYGIYSIDADGQGLVMCLDVKKRPKKFEAPAGTDCLLIRLRRQ